MKTLIILAIVGLIAIVYMVLTAQPYPKELQDKEDEELIEKFKEHKKSQDK